MNVKEKWGDVDKPEDLYNYINKEVMNIINENNSCFYQFTQVSIAREDPSYRPWKPNCQMTPNTNDIIIGGISLREFADAVNR